MDWQPIETAPKDGTEIILAVRGHPATKYWVHIGWWEEGDSFPWRFIDSFDLTTTGCCEEESDDRITVNGAKEDGVAFWMHLPAPPSAAMSISSPAASDARASAQAVTGSRLPPAGIEP